MTWRASSSTISAALPIAITLDLRALGEVKTARNLDQEILDRRRWLLGA
jgi:hypothetical protein